MYLIATVSTIIAWLVGLLVDATTGFEPQGFLCLRVLLPLLAMGLCILRAVADRKSKRDN